MTAQPFRLDPEVEQVLQEVARDPNSSLLRVERPTDLRGLLESEPRVGVATAGLTLAERHLVQTRRAETALALRALCLRELICDARGEHMFSREGTIDVSSLDTLLATFRKKWLADPTAHQEAVGCDGGIVLSGAINNSIPGPNFLAMTAAAARLEPAVVTQVYSAQWLILNRQFRSAINLLHSALNCPTSGRSLSIAMANIALAYNMAGQLDRSLEWYQRASEVMSSNTASTCGLLVVAAQVGNEREFLKAAAVIDRAGTSKESELDWQCRAQRARHREFSRQLRPAGRDLLLRGKDQLGPLSRRLVDALT